MLNRELCGLRQTRSLTALRGRRPRARGGAVRGSASKTGNIKVKLL